MKTRKYNKNTIQHHYIHVFASVPSFRER